MTDEDLELCHVGLRSILGHYGRLAAKDAEGRVVDSGSAVFLSIDGTRVILTADHVLRGLVSKGTLHLQVPPPNAGLEADLAHVPVEFALDSTQTLAIDGAGRLDATLILPPPPVLATTWLGWFDASTQVAALNAVRLEAAKLEASERLAAVIVGFPRFVRFEDAELRIQAAGSFPVPAAIERFTDPPAILGRAREISLQVFAPTIDDLATDAFPLVRTGVENLPGLVAAGESAMGGYSGAPLMYFCPNGNWVLGIMKEAGLELGGQAFATAIDDIVAAVRASDEWLCLLSACGSQDAEEDRG